MTSEEISKMDLGKNIDSKKASGEFGFIKQFKDGSFEIIINKDKPAVGTAAHEFMHAILNKTLSNNKKTQNQLAKELKSYVSTLKGEGVDKLKNRLNSYKNDEALGEETIVVMSESILDGSLKFNESFFTKIGDVVRRFLQDTGLKQVKFNTGRDVYNFIKDYNTSIKKGKLSKAIINVAKEGAKGKLTEKTDVDIDVESIRFSRGALIDDVNKMQKGATTQTEFQDRKIKRCIKRYAL